MQAGDSASPSPAATAATLGVPQQDSATLECVLQRLLYRDTFGLPKLMGDSSEDIRSHIDKMDNYFEACTIKNQSVKTTILLNSITEDMQMELCGLLDFKRNENDYKWLTEKLLELYHPKETELSPYIKLFSHRQAANQSTREFLSEIRREGYRLLRSLKPEEREEKMIEAFCNGLLNKEVRKALKNRKLETLDEAFNLIKREKMQPEDRMIRVVTSHENNRQQTQTTDLEKMQNQITMIQKQLSYIVSILQAGAPPNASKNNTGVQKPSYAQVAGHQPAYRNRIQNDVGFRRRPVNPIKCFCCGREGHIARMCTMKCTNCGRSGHREDRCFFRGTRSPNVMQPVRRPNRNIRLLRDAQSDGWMDFDCETMSTSSPSHEENLAETDQERSQEPVDLNSIFIQGMNGTETASDDNQLPCIKVIQSVEKRTMKSRQKRITYPDEVNQWADYIEGRVSKKPKTLISSKHSEKAANKPIIIGSCQGHMCKMLCDSGAEVNVIDEALLREIQATDSTVKIRASKKSVKCANNSSMSVAGMVRLKLEFSTVSKWCNFLVVKNLFPKVIVGIRAMKDLKMTIDPCNNQVVVSGAQIPFLSRVYAETECGQGNDI